MSWLQIYTWCEYMYIYGRHVRDTRHTVTFIFFLIKITHVLLKTCTCGSKWYKHFLLNILLWTYTKYMAILFVVCHHYSLWHDCYLSAWHVTQVNHLTFDHEPLFSELLPTVTSPPGKAGVCDIKFRNGSASFETKSTRITPVVKGHAKTRGISRTFWMKKRNIEKWKNEK